MKLFLVGGFLGSGKTTAIHQACLVLQRLGRKVAVITNDQGADLVDTGFMEDAGITTKEVPQGCFCCNYDQLSNAVADLQKPDMPDLIFAESVGSCTDLVATIANPFNKFNPEIEVVISVFADASLLLALLSGNASFLNDDVRYIYKKQLEEADIIVVNKVDLLDQGQLQHLRDQLDSEYHHQRIIYQSLVVENGVLNWINELSRFEQPRRRTSLEIDYDRYGRGEAILAWLDQRIIVETNNGTASKIAFNLIDQIATDIKAAGFTIAHLKFLVDDGIKTQKISATTTGNLDDHSRSATQGVDKVEILINARIEADPSALDELVCSCLQGVRMETGCRIEEVKKSFFRPGYPRPTHRIL